VRHSYFTHSVQSGLVEATATFAAAARDAGSELVVNLSQLLSREPGGAQPTPHQTRHWLAAGDRLAGPAGVC
jgi:NAD(P)H dehydrogenase (quinone)